MKVPLVLAIGVGAILAAVLEALYTDGFYWPPAKNMVAIVFTEIVILPISFGALSYAARFVPFSTVSLIMLLEKVLGPLWVGWGIGEAPTVAMQ